MNVAVESPSSPLPSRRRHPPMTKEERRVIFASSLGTVFEWYDFYLYGSLAAVIGAQFFSKDLSETTRQIFALLAFAAGFLVRPFGALVFGRLGDLVGRKYTFLITIVIMGSATFLVGVLPPYSYAGALAPIILITLRLLQGLALGGEYGGAATYVAEHAPQGRRGYFTSWIQTTATLGLFMSLLVILFTRTFLGEAAFADYGWRIPFLLSAILLVISVWIRLRLNESPLFKKMKEEGRGSKAPLHESFGNWSNAKIVILALLGLTMGQGVVWYTGQFYALFFLTNVLKVDGYSANLLIAWSLLLGTGFFLFFGWLSDKIGRKPIILAGCFLAAATYIPLFKQISTFANPALEHAIETVSVRVIADPETCGNLFDPVNIRNFTAPCDVSRRLLASLSVRYTMEPATANKPTLIMINNTPITFSPAPEFRVQVTDALQRAGYPKAGDARILALHHPLDVLTVPALGTIGILVILVIYVTMVYGPIAAALVELFPTRIRYTSMSLPYHIGNGWFGGLLPATALMMVAQTGDIYFGLWYPILFASLTFIIGLLFIPETKDRSL